MDIRIHLVHSLWEALTDAYATATFLKLTSLCHQVDVEKIKEMESEPMSPIQAGRGWRPARNVVAWLVDDQRLNSGYVSANLCLCFLSL